MKDDNLENMGTATPMPAGASAEREGLSEREDGTETSERGVEEPEVAAANSLREVIEVLLRSPVSREAVRRVIQPEPAAMPEARPAQKTPVASAEGRSDEERNHKTGGFGEASKPAELGFVSQRGMREAEGAGANDGEAQKRSAVPNSAHGLRRDVPSMDSGVPQFVSGVKGEAERGKGAPGETEPAGHHTSGEAGGERLAIGSGTDERRASGIAEGGDGIVAGAERGSSGNARGVGAVAGGPRGDGQANRSGGQAARGARGGDLQRVKGGSKAWRTGRDTGRCVERVVDFGLRLCL